MSTIYLDHQATTPLDPAVLEAMLPWLSAPANPHALENADGHRASRAVEHARGQIADAFGAESSGIVFTGNATEAANIVLRSFAGSALPIVTTSIEHPCVADTAADLARTGTPVAVIPVDGEGLVSTDAVHEALDAGASLMSCMAVNNEVGTIQPIGEISAACRIAGVPYHMDAVQALGRIPLRIGDFDYATISAHKVYGPQGIGAIVSTRGGLRRLHPLSTGGGQERGLRPGTLPVAACVGFGEACAIAVARMTTDDRSARAASGAFLAELRAVCPDALVNGSEVMRIPQNLSIAVPGVDAQELLASVPRLALSTGSACASGAIGTSRVLVAMDVAQEIADATVRVGFGRFTSVEDAAAAGRMLGDAARRLAARRRIR